MLITSGAHVKTKGQHVWTPLHEAVCKDSKDIVELLIAKGADVDFKDDRGRTPLWWANNRSHTKIVDPLRKHGAKD